MNRQVERNAARHWVEGNAPRFDMERWNKAETRQNEAIGRRIKAKYDDAIDPLPARIRELLAELNRLPAPSKPEP